MQRVEVMERMAPILDLDLRTVHHSPNTRVLSGEEGMGIRTSRSTALVPITREGGKSMATFAGFPEPFINRLTSDTFGRVATELLSQKGEYSLVMKGGQVIAFAKPGEHRRIQPERALGAIERGIPHADYHKVHVMAEAVRLEIVGHEQRAVSRGDWIRGGAMIEFSPIGVVTPHVQAYVLRLACTNGVTSMDYLRNFQFSGDNGNGNIWNWFSNSARDAYGSLRQVVERFQLMRQESIPERDRAAVLEQLIRNAQLPQAAAIAVRAEAIAHPPRTAYDALNLITWASSNVPQVADDPLRVARAQQVAATFAHETTHARICPTCNRSR